MSAQSLQSGVLGLLERAEHERPASTSSLKLRVGIAIVALFVLAALFAPLLAPYPPDRQDLLHSLAGPSAQHLLGTDAVGRDVLSRVIYATRVDLPVAGAAVLIPALIGSLVGLLAGYFGRVTDTAVMRTADLVLAFPVYVLVLALIAVLGPGAGSIIIATALVDGTRSGCSVAGSEARRTRRRRWSGRWRNSAAGAGWGEGSPSPSSSTSTSPSTRSHR